MKSFFKGLFFTAFTGALVPAVNIVAGGHLDGKTIGTAAVIGAAGGLAAYLHPNPTQQQ